MLVAVAGASGHVGRRLVAFLRAKKVPVIALVRSKASASSLPAGTPFKVVDLQTGVGLPAALRHATHVVNLTGRVDDAPEHELYLANVLPTRQLLIAAPASLRRFVHVSSIAVYGKRPRNPVTERSPRHADGAYARTKLSGENLALSCASRFSVVVVQPAIIYGPGFESGFYPVLRQLQTGRARLIGSGGNRLPFVHVDDVVSGLYAALTARVPSGSAFLLSSDDSPTQAQALSAAAQELGVPAPARSIPPTLASLSTRLLSFVRRLQGKPSSITPEMVAQLSSDRVFDSSRARRQLHWRPSISFKTGVRQVVNQYKQPKKSM
ncbi:MAG: NAD-dependent epimerase/dehydratase family protein [Candidatus Micrarchaeota archaeon]|nr:NAD-dependent epimerase/dehydratase family protein [Candidatus Micrarchaeota archaeon]